MSQTLIDLINQLDQDLFELKERNLSFNQETSETIVIIESYLFQVQNILQNHLFSSTEAEIDFFKNIYPKLFKMYYYHQIIYNMENEKNDECISKSKEKKFYKNYLNEIKLFQQDEIKNLKEIRFCAILSEKKLFLRKYYRFRRKFLMFSINDTFVTNSISTAIGKREAYAEAIQFIENCINENENNVQENLNLNWTDKKAFLVELIYAIYLKESINNGKVELIRLIRFFEKHFNVALHNHHSIIQELKRRKRGKTRYFDQIKNLLLNKLEE